MILTSALKTSNAFNRHRVHLNHFVKPAILFAWCLFLFGYGLNTGTLYRTEALRAIIGREALHGSWLVPTLYGEPFLTKPPGCYIAIALCSLPFGEVTTWSARLPSVLAATITVFLFYYALKRVVRNRMALLGAMLMPVSFLWLDKAPSAEIDMLQVMWVSAALLFFLRAVENDQQKKQFLWWTLSLLCVAFGFLTKWTAPAFFYLTVSTMLAWQRRLSLLWSWRHLVAVGTGIGVCGLWVGAVIQQVGWPVLRDTFLAEAAQRFAPHHGGRAYPWLESLAYPFQVLGANLPWSLLALYACRPSFVRSWNENGKRFVQLLHCWTWPNLLFWSLPAQHHLRYSMPMCPGLVGLGVMVLLKWVAGEPSDVSRRVIRQHPAAYAARLARRNLIPAILIAWCVIKIVHVEFIVPPRTAQRHARETAARLSELVPPGETLYLGRVKDEGILFYYNRPARRLTTGQRTAYALLLEAEWREQADNVALVERLTDQQGDPIILVRYP